MLMTGCLRFGYQAPHVQSNLARDAGQLDTGVDAAVIDAGRQIDASVRDASTTADASHPTAGSGASDAAMAEDDGTAMPPPTDAAVSGTSACPAALTTNMYVGNPHYHGTLLLQNTGTSTWTTPTISFDLPSTAYICNDASKLPGNGWSLQSSAGHCAYTKTSPSLSIAPGASFTFEYSTNDEQSESPAVIHLIVSGCP